MTGLIGIAMQKARRAAMKSRPEGLDDQDHPLLLQQNIDAAMKSRPEGLDDKDKTLSRRALAASRNEVEARRPR